jgi:hypothetical protein
VIKTERKVEQEKKSKHKRRHTVVLSDGEDDQAQARAAESESFPNQLMAYLKRIDGMHMRSSPPKSRSCSTGRVRSTESFTSRAATSTRQLHRTR